MNENAAPETGAFGRVVGICSRLSIVLGVLIGVTQLWKPLKDASATLQSMKLSTLQQVNQFVEADSAARVKIKTFLSEWDKPGGSKLVDLLKSDRSGEEVFLSEQLSDLRDVGRHYERMGVLVKLGYLDFDLVYEIISFPDRFWDVTKDFRDKIRNDGWSQGKGLDDFWRNFEDLHDRYERKRAVERRKKTQ
jgi:hypothetical protein